MPTPIANDQTRICPVCKDNNYQTWFRPAQSPGPVVACNHCKFVYVNPVENSKALIREGPVLGDRPSHLLGSANLNDIVGSWEQPIIESYMKHLPARQRNAQAALSRLNALQQKRGKILDVGCFCGVFLSVAAQERWECYGIEPLVMPAVYARGRFGLNITTGTLDDSVYKQDFFDVITAFQVFEHMLDPKKELERIYRLLKPGGLVLIEVPNIDTLGVKILGHRHRHFVQDHVSFFSIETLSHLLEKTGFEVLAHYYPTRYLDTEQFVQWLEKHKWIFGERLAPLIQALFQRLGTKMIQINLRDIIALIAKKV
jgi:2-polyprenyl-3-methyl-5-hydroxy-6-metoxy-1,4-benzoquinol methylase